MSENQEESNFSKEQIEELTNLSKQGYQLLRESLNDRAREVFNRMLAIDNRNQYALVGLGDSWRKERKFKEAEGFYLRCLEFHKSNNYALFGLAECYKNTNQFNRAVEVWETYLQHDDPNPTVLTRIADAYRKVRNFDRSREMYQRVLETDSDNPYALIGLGHLHYDFKKYEDALGYWNRIEEQKGFNTDIRVLTSIGNCHRKLKDFQKGSSYFLRALEKQPGNFYALFGLADCYRGLNEPEKSLEYWNRILEKDKRNKVILTRAGDAYRTLGRTEKAAEYYRKALAIDFDLYAELGLAIIAKEAGQVKKALASLEELIGKEPKNHRLSLETADCHEKLGQPERAIAVLESYLAQGIYNESVESYARRLKERS